MDSAVGYLLDLGFPIDAQRLKRTFHRLSYDWFRECATDHVEKCPEDAASWVEKFGSFPAPPQSPTERQAQQDRRLILAQGAKNLAEFVRGLRRDVCRVPAVRGDATEQPQDTEMAEPATKADGIAARNAWFHERYHDKGSDTYHSPTKIAKAWADLGKEGQRKVAPGAVGNVSKYAVQKAIYRRGREKQLDAKPSKRKRPEKTRQR
ncbi:MAG: hypothetical protein NTW96_25160 [Planctomycetia bacterium]|nr:hypothetical protein [Planctomycetia bacterium]